MHRIAESLEAWRSAERRRDALPPGSAEWQAADEDARSAQKAYRAEASQATAYHVELDFAAANEHRFALWPRRSERTTSDTG